LTYFGFEVRKHLSNFVKRILILILFSQLTQQLQIVKLKLRTFAIFDNFLQAGSLLESLLRLLA
jgi:hypothetical protein